MRYGMLESIRQYALARLAAAGEDAALRRRHLGWLADFAGKADLRGPDQAAWLDLLEAELDNFRAGLEWSLAPPDRNPGRDPALALRLAGALAPFWLVRGPVGAGRMRWRRPARGRRPGQGGLDPAQQGRKRVGVGRRERRHERLEPGPDQALGRPQEPLAVRGQGEPPPAAVVARRGALDRPGPLEPGDELGDRGLRDARGAREVGGRVDARRDRPQAEVLAERERRIRSRQDALHPAGDERGDGREGLGGVSGAGMRGHVLK